MRELWGGIVDALSAFSQEIGSTDAGSFGLAGLLAGASAGAALLTLYFVLRDRINPFRKAKDNVERGHLRRAFSLLAVELHRNPSNRPALLLRADIERDRGLYAEAEEDYYSLIDLKKPGDGIDVLEVKKRLIPVLHNQGKLLEALKAVRDVLSAEGSSADALFHLGLLYLGQLYYHEAWKVLERVIGSRPAMSPAFLAASIALVQLREFEKAIDLAEKARRIDGNPLCALVAAAAHLLMGNSREAERVLATLPRREKTFESPECARLYHRLSAFAALKSNSPDSAVEHLMEVQQTLKQEEAGKRVGKGPGWGRRAPTPMGSLQGGKLRPAVRGVYDQFGRIEEGEEPRRGGFTPEEYSRGADGAAPEKKAMAEELVRDYFRLKEVTRDEWLGRGTGTSRTVQPGLSGAGVRGVYTTGAFFDLEGLSRLTWAALDLGFCLVRAGRLSRARELFEDLSRSNPEVLGVRRIVELLREKESEPAANEPQERGDIRERTDRVVAKKKRRYELWEYVERWEEEGIRPFHLMSACGFVAQKRLDPRLLFPVKGLSRGPGVGPGPG
jgi:tetratricopeptide (TPR) repeat protein